MDDFKDTVYHLGWLGLLIMVAIPNGWHWFDTFVVGVAALLTIPMFLWDYRDYKERRIIEDYLAQAEAGIPLEEFKWGDCAEGCCS